MRNVSEELAYIKDEMPTAAAVDEPGWREWLAPCRLAGGALIIAGGYITVREMMISFDSARASGADMANVAATLAFVKALLPTCVVAAVFYRKNLGWFGTFSTIGACLLGMLVFHGYSGLAAVDFAFSGREKIAAAHEQSASKRKRSEDRYEAASAQYRSLSGQRPAGEIDADKSRIEADITAASKRAEDAGRVEAAHAVKACGILCNQAADEKKAALAEQRSLNDRLAAFRAELKLSIDRDAAKLDMEDARRELDKMEATGRKDAEAYNKAVLLATLGFSVDPENPRHVEIISLMKSLFQGLAAEVGAFVTLLVGFTIFNLNRAERAVAVVGIPAVRSRPIQAVETEAVRQQPAAIESWSPRDMPAIPARKLSQEEKGYRALRTLICQHGEVERHLPSLGPVIGEGITDGYVVPKQTLSDWLKRWNANGLIIQREDGKTVFLSLPRQQLALAHREAAETEASL